MIAYTAEELARLEPWRKRQGQPRNALQLDWLEKPEVCTGSVIFDTVTETNKRPWWHCKKCGYCSCYSNITHFAPEHPADFYSASLEFFYSRRKNQGISHEQAKQQAGHLIGMVLRNAAKLSPDELARYIEEHVVLKDI